MTITLNDMKDQLLTFDAVYSRLEATEPLSDILIDSTSKTSFRLMPSWNETAKNAPADELVEAYITVNGTEYQFNKEGILYATSLIGLKASYVLKTPANFIESQLNYWFNTGLEESAHKMLVVKDVASAFIRPTLVPFSNIELLESVHSGINNFYGETEVFADYKFNHSLQRTDIRLIVPRQMRTITGTDMADVPTGSQDVWSSGISLTNSLSGKSQTSMDAYLFRWWCTNGAIAENSEVGNWNRKTNGQTEDSVYEWAALTVEDVLSGIERNYDSIQKLVTIKPKGVTADVLEGIFKDNKVPVSQRESITNDVISSNTINMYSIMNAITSQANNPTLAPDRVDKLMRIGGGIPDHYFDPIKSRIFHQGQVAGPDAENPYLVTN